MYIYILILYIYILSIVESNLLWDLDLSSSTFVCWNRIEWKFKTWINNRMPN